MSRTVYEIRRARKEHQCTERGYHTIRVGEQYLYAVCPPEHEANRTRPGDRRRFEVIKACLRCADEFGLRIDTLKLIRQHGFTTAPSRPDAPPDAIQRIKSWCRAGGVPLE